MKKYSRKIALILVLALTLAMAVPVLAWDGEEDDDGNGPGNGTTEITGSYLSTGGSKIEITMPNGTAHAWLNPSGGDAYWLDEDCETLSEAGDSSVRLRATGQITTLPITCQNFGNKAVRVYAKVTGDLKIHTNANGAATASGNNFKFSTSLPKTSSNNGYIYLEAKAVKEADIANDKLIETMNAWTFQSADVNKKGVAVGTYTALSKDMRKKLTKEDAKTKVLLKSGTSSCAEPVCVMEARGGQNKNAMVARLAGWIGTNPTGTKRWSPTDGFKTTIAWTFELSQ